MSKIALEAKSSAFRCEIAAAGTIRTRGTMSHDDAVEQKFADWSPNVFLRWALISSVVFFAIPAAAHAGFFSNLWGLLSGNEAGASASAAVVDAFPPLLGSQSANPPPVAKGDVVKLEDEYDSILLVTEDGAVVAPRNPAGTLTDTIHPDAIAVYTVKPGDTPSSIAKQFGVTLNTILWANDLTAPDRIKIGDELVILPVSGVQYKVKKGDTIESIAKRFKPKDEPDISSVIADVTQFNGLAINEVLEPGTTLIIPDGEIGLLLTPVRPSSSATRIPSRFANLPELKGYFLRPITGGRRSRGIHGYNGIDLASSCGFPVFTSAQGTVIQAKSDGWNGGYGKYIVITHPEGPQTLYAHLSAINVAVGQRVAQGIQIGDIGSTGNSSGCHVHFEIRGAKNPF